MFVLPYILALNFDFDFLKVLDIVFFIPKIFDKMLAFLNL